MLYVIQPSKMFFLKKLFNSTILGLTLGVLLVGYGVFAFNPPTQAPPAGNVPAPINTGASNQTKTGGLLNVFGLWVNQSLGVSGGATFGGALNLQGNRITNVGSPTAAGDATTKGYADGAHGKQMFTSSGTFTVPAGVTAVYTTMVGGGGGGSGGNGTGGGSEPGADGGNSYFGASCAAGTNCAQGGGGSGSAGNSLSSPGSAGGSGGSDTNGAGGNFGGIGGSTIFGGYVVKARTLYLNSRYETFFDISGTYGYGAGGRGGGGEMCFIGGRTWIYGAGGTGGGGGGVLLSTLISVTPGSSVGVFVGDGGRDGGGGARGSSCWSNSSRATGGEPGRKGFVLVEW